MEATGTAGSAPHLTRSAEPSFLGPHRRRLQTALVLAPVVFLVYMGWQRRWTADDGFINLRIVRQILAGNGPVFNAATGWRPGPARCGSPCSPCSTG